MRIEAHKCRRDTQYENMASKRQRKLRKHLAKINKLIISLRIFFNLDHFLFFSFSYFYVKLLWFHMN